MKKYLLFMLLFFPVAVAHAQVDPGLSTRLQQTPIIVDHTSIGLFEQIPDLYIQRAANIHMMWGDRSVGGNISSGLDCLVSPTDEQAINSCKRNAHHDTRYLSPASWTNWSRTGGYPRSNWIFFFDPGLGVTPELSCAANTPAWIGCFLEHATNTASLHDVFSYQHSYLTIMPGSDILGYFQNQSTRADIFDYQTFGTTHGKTLIYWTTSLSRSQGTVEGTSYNNQMRAWIRNGTNKILFDVADIESHDPSGSPCYDHRDDLEYCTQNGNCENHPDDGIDEPAICQHYTTEIDGGHLYDPAKIMMAKLYWVLMAQIAGWQPGVQSTLSPTNSSTSTPTSSPSPTSSTTLTPTVTPAVTVDHGTLLSLLTLFGQHNCSSLYNFTPPCSIDIFDYSYAVDRFGISN